MEVPVVVVVSVVCGEGATDRAVRRGEDGPVPPGAPFGSVDLM